MTNFRALFFMLILAIIIISIVGCKTSNDDIISMFTSEEEDQYKAVVFIEMGDEDKSLIKTTGRIRITYYYLLEDFYTYEIDKDLEIDKQVERYFRFKEYPMYLIFDNKGLVLKTNSLNELNTFLKNLPVREKK